MNGDDTGDGPTADASIMETDAFVESVPPDAPPAPACATGRKVYLVFGGVQVAKGATSDGTAIPMRISWMNNATATVPPYHQGVATRAAQITTITDGIKAQLANTPIEVVTEKPAVGPWVTVIFGGTNTTYGTPFLFGTNAHDCGDVVKNDVAYVSNTPSVELAQDLAIGGILWGLGMNGTTNVNDCMCNWGNNCVNAAGRCTLSTNIATVTSTGTTTCPNLTTQNELDALKTQFCQ